MALRQKVRQASAATLSVAVFTLIFAFALAQAQEPKSTVAPPAKSTQSKSPKSGQAPKGKTKAKGTRLVPGGPRAKTSKEAADPIGKVANDDPKVKAAIDEGAYHYKLKIVTADGSSSIAASYYPSQLGSGASVVLLVHEKDRSSKDFQDPILELEGKGLCESLQKLGIAVLAIDLRGQGDNPRKATSAKDWRQMPADLQTAYIFLLDRHNRGELNVSRLGVLGLGEGANLVANWAVMPGAATTSPESGKSDVASLVLISPMADAHAVGLPAQKALTNLAPRLPICLLAGERDSVSSPLVKAVQAAVKRYRTNQVTLYPSSLHGYKLMRLEPDITKAITRFFEDTIKTRAETWEPRYNLSPVSFTDVKTVANPKAPSAAKAKESTPAGAAKAKDASQ